MLLALEADKNAVLSKDELVLSLQDTFEVFLIEVDASKLIDDLINRLNQLHPLLKMIRLIYLF